MRLGSASKAFLAAGILHLIGTLVTTDSGRALIGFGAHEGPPNVVSHEYIQALYVAIKWTALYLTTVIGILFNILWRSSAIKIDSELLTLPTMKPLLVSPIIFYPVYLLANSTPDTLVAFLLAFQNGFFWQSVFGKQEQQVLERSSQAEPKP